MLCILSLFLLLPFLPRMGTIILPVLLPTCSAFYTVNVDSIISAASVTAVFSSGMCNVYVLSCIFFCDFMLNIILSAPKNHLGWLKITHVICYVQYSFVMFLNVFVIL